ncbi:PucR family transcriptional regulator [Pseudactinotalea sp. Z1739]|uniref:PucR family transcriptional regulator n=1 Tax=Pseudactinotalea sp. Z1739 TaxID=3413028 RepID=UPI003C7A1558
MVEVANDAAPSPHILPKVLEGEWGYGITVAELVSLPALAGTRVLAGATGLDRRIERANVMEVPDITAWVKPRELLITTGYAIRETPQVLPSLIAEFDDRHLAGLAIKLGRYLDELPEAVIVEADRRGFPILALPDISFDEVLTAVFTEVLDRQSALLAGSERLHRELLHLVAAGGTLADVTNRLATLIDARIMVTTADGRVLTEAGAGSAEDGLRREASGRVLVEDLAYGYGAGPPHRIVVPVVAGRYDHGRLVATSAERPLRQVDVHAIERAAIVVALSLSKQRELSAVEGKYQGDFLRDVLMGRAGDRDQVLAHARGLGWDLERPFVVLVAEHDDPAPRFAGSGDRPQPPQDRFAAAWRSIVTAKDPAAAVVSLSSEVVALIGVPAGAPTDAESIARGFVAAVSGDGGGGRQSFCTGISRVVHDVADLRRGYEQARSAVRVGRWQHGPGALVEFDALGVQRLLSLVSDPAEIDSFITDVLADLAEDTPEAEDLRQTLDSLLAHNLNVAETARDLHFHYNTLRYRISKLERLVGPFTSDAHLRLDLAVALRAHRLRPYGPTRR